MYGRRADCIVRKSNNIDGRYCSHNEMSLSLLFYSLALLRGSPGLTSNCLAVKRTDGHIDSMNPDMVSVNRLGGAEGMISFSKEVTTRLQNFEVQFCSISIFFNQSL